MWEWGYEEGKYFGTDIIANMYNLKFLCMSKNDLTPEQGDTIKQIVNMIVDLIVKWTKGK